MILMLVLVSIGGLVLLRALVGQAMVRQHHWQRAILAIGLMLSVLVGYSIPIFWPTSSSLQADASIHLSNGAGLQATLTRLNQAESTTNPAYTTLLNDYTTYHAVLVVEGGLFTLVLGGLGIVLWRRFKRAKTPNQGFWSFERNVYAYLGLASTTLAIGLLLIVAANLSNVINAQAGFAKTIPDLRSSAGTPKAALYQAVESWAETGSAATPAILQHQIDNRLAWQGPKALVASMLLLIFAFATTKLWQKLIRASRSNQGRWKLQGQAQLALGILAVPTTGLLMLMALANTQGSLAPITLTLLFS
ncbi:hypothetical protein ACP8Y2_22825 [Herpetosiphon llansteffanensis]